MHRLGSSGVKTSPARHFDSVAGKVGDGPETRRQRAEAAAAAAEARAAQARRAVGQRRVANYLWRELWKPGLKDQTLP